MDKKIYQYVVAGLILCVLVYIMYEYKTKQMIETEFKKLSSSNNNKQPKPIEIQETDLRMEDIDSYIDPLDKNDSDE